MVPVEPLDLLKLVSVPVAHGAVLAATEEVVPAALAVVRHERHL